MSGSSYGGYSSGVRRSDDRLGTRGSNQGNRRSDVRDRPGANSGSTRGGGLSNEQHGTRENTRSDDPAGTSGSHQENRRPDNRDRSGQYGPNRGGRMSDGLASTRGSSRGNTRSDYLTGTRGLHQGNSRSDNRDRSGQDGPNRGGRMSDGLASTRGSSRGNTRPDDRAGTRGSHQGNSRSDNRDRSGQDGPNRGGRMSDGLASTRGSSRGNTRPDDRAGTRGSHQGNSRSDNRDRSGQDGPNRGGRMSDGLASTRGSSRGNTRPDDRAGTRGSHQGNSRSDNRDRSGQDGPNRSGRMSDGLADTRGSSRGNTRSDYLTGTRGSHQGNRRPDSQDRSGQDGPNRGGRMSDGLASTRGSTRGNTMSDDQTGTPGSHQGNRRPDNRDRSGQDGPNRGGRMSVGLADTRGSSRGNTRSDYQTGTGGSHQGNSRSDNRDRSGQDGPNRGGRMSDGLASTRGSSRGNTRSDYLTGTRGSHQKNSRSDNQDRSGKDGPNRGGIMSEGLADTTGSNRGNTRSDDLTGTPGSYLGNSRSDNRDRSSTDGSSRGGTGSRVLYGRRGSGEPNRGIEREDGRSDTRGSSGGDRSLNHSGADGSIRGGKMSDDQSRTNWPEVRLISSDVPPEAARPSKGDMSSDPRPRTIGSHRGDRRLDNRHDQSETNKTFNSNRSSDALPGYDGSNRGTVGFGNRPGSNFSSSKVKRSDVQPEAEASNRGNDRSHNVPGTKFLRIEVTDVQSEADPSNTGNGNPHGQPGTIGSSPGDKHGTNGPCKSDSNSGHRPSSNCSTKGGRSFEDPSGISGSSNGLKRRREPSPKPSTSFGPSITISSAIFETSPNEADMDMRDTNQKNEVRDPEVTADMQNLPNFFTFTDPSKIFPSVAPQRNVGETGAPALKLPKVAHYNARRPDEEVQYVEQGRRFHKQAIPDHESDTDDDFEEEMPAPLSNRTYHLKDKVFDKYDFKRPNEPTKLMAYEHKDKIINAIEANRVVIIDGFTGCGKTTQVPQLIIDQAVELRRPCNVIVTQPRRIAAISVARRVCEERSWELGTVVGYQVGFEKRTCHDTLVTYMTTGVLLQKLIRDKSLQKWTHIFVDEVHERDLDTDLLLLLIKKILIEDKYGKERHVKLILMSATVNSRQFSQYFPVSKFGDESVETPVIKIPTIKKFKIEDFFLDQLISSTSELEGLCAKIDMDKAALIPELYTQAVRTIKDLDRQEASYDPRFRHAAEDKIIQKNRGSVLVFLPGIMEIKELQKRLIAENRKKVEEIKCSDPNPFQWEIVPLHSSITNEEQQKVFEHPKPYRRKIILSTNIAESSITVPDIVYVIDFCLTKSDCVDARTNFSCLRICWASVSQCIQRAGRSGRVRDGKVYRMIPKRTYAQLDQDATPDMLKSALEDVVLRVKILDMGSPKDILCLALDPPEISGIERAVSNLKEVGAMTVMTTVNNQPIYSTCDGDLTFMGRIMTVLPVSPQCARLIMLGHCFGVMKEAIIIAASLSGKSPFSQSFNNQKQQLDFHMQKINWAKKSYSDCLAIVHAYRAWYIKFAETDDYLSGGRKSNVELNWARQNSIQMRQMRDIRNTVQEIEQRLRDQKLIQNHLPNESSLETDSDNLPKKTTLMLKIAIAGAFYPNYFHRQRPCSFTSYDYERDRSKEVNGHDLFRTVFYKDFPSGHNGKLYAKHVADFLSHGLSEPYVKFEGRKVLAIFDSTTEKIGPISVGVYRAIKKRLIQDKLEFKLLRKENEKEPLRKFDDEVQRRRFIRCPPQIALPRMDQKKIDVFITHVENPSQFWIVYKDMLTQHTKMSEKINGNITKIPLRGERVYVGALVLAPFQDDRGTCYCRGRILTLQHGHGDCLIYFIDYGNSVRINVNALLELPKELIQQKYNQIPGMAIESRLCLLKPTIMHGSVWANAAVAKFKTITTDTKYFEFRIHAVDKSVISGELLSIPENHSGAESFNFNKWLLEDFADPAPESYTANQNHLIRSQFHILRQDRKHVEDCNRQQIAEPIDRDFIPPPTGSIACTLEGPYSPLEINFQSVCQSSNAKQVTVDGQSVNSVSLDHEPTTPTARLLVASSISIQEKTGRVVARETTLMSPTPGMLSLMSLIFAPRAELRCDNSMTRYTGALCGLGTANLNEPEPIYMDHDMEIAFDTEIDDDDIDSINKIRYLMNVLLRKSQGENNAPLHLDLCNGIIRLLKKSRKRVENQFYPPEPYVWNRILPSKIIPTDRNLYRIQPLDIFLPHDKIKLTPEDCTMETFDFEP